MPITDTLPIVGWHHVHAWMPLAADQVQVGDVYANHGTVTAVHLGPMTDGHWGDLLAGQVRLECGDSMATTGRAGRVVVIGRRIAQLDPDTL